MPTDHALIQRWRSSLPIRAMRAPRRHRLSSWLEPAAQVDSGQAAGQPFDFCAAVRALVSDIAERCPEFHHLHVPRILVTVTQARGPGRHGLQARVTPLRFPGGALTRQRRGVPFHIQRYFLDDHEYLYLLTFCLPRFLEQDFDQKLVTVFHELHHISPAFDGDLRRHAGRYHYHSHSQREYDGHMVHHARAYLASNPEPRWHRFLRLSFAQLQERHGSVIGVVVPRPKIIPLIGPYAAAAKISD